VPGGEPVKGTGPAQDSREATPLADLAAQLRTVAQRIENLFLRQFDTIGLHLNDNQSEYRRQEAHFSQLMVDKAVSDQEHTEYAEKVISLADAYEQGFIRSLQSLNDEISKELIDFEQVLDRVSERTDRANQLASLRQWLSLSQELQTARIMATRGIIDQVKFDKRIPKMIVERHGSVDITLFRDRSKEFSDGSATYTSFIKQSFADHERIQPQREPLYQKLFASDHDITAVDRASITAPQQRVRSINPLEAKSWFRLVKVVYIGLWIVGIGAVVVVAIAFQSQSVLVFGCLATSALLLGLKKAFYYVIFGRTTAIEPPDTASSTSKT
jgi:hypothetical protein